MFEFYLREEKEKEKRNIEKSSWFINEVINFVWILFKREREREKEEEEEKESEKYRKIFVVYKWNEILFEFWNLREREREKKKKKKKKNIRDFPN